MSRSAGQGNRRFLASSILTLAGAAVLFAACSSPAKTSTSAATNAPAPTTPTTSAGPGASDAAVTVAVADVPGLGNILVDGNGRTLYVLASEKGGKVTCTSAGGCTTIWPAVVLPSGMGHGIAGSGVQASLLGTATAPGGDVRVTYGGWPLYTFVKDTAPGQATGQELKDSFGLWLVLSPSGNPITTAAPSSTPAQAPVTNPPATSPPATSPPATSPPTTSAPSSGGAGF